MMPDPNVLEFGLAGVLFTGPDAEVRQHCAAIAATYQRFIRGRGNTAEAYTEACILIDRRVDEVAAIQAVTPEGIKAKAAAMLPLAAVGMAGYGQRTLAASLARDILGLEQPVMTRLFRAPGDPMPIKPPSFPTLPGANRPPVRRKPRPEPED